MDRQFDDILNECFELMLKGETLEHCLERYPEHASELEPLLRVAFASRELKCITPGPEFKARARYQFREALAEATTKKRRFSLLGIPRWASVVSLVAGFMMVASGTVAAAGNSMPDSPLYPVKMATEEAQMQFTFSREAKAELQIEQTNERVGEILYMANKGDAQEVEKLTVGLSKRLDKLTELVSSAGGAQSAITSMSGSPPTQEPTTPIAPALAPSPRMPSEVPEPTAEATPPAKDSSKDSAPNKRMFNQSDTGRAKLKMELADLIYNHPAIIEQILKEVPESSRPALRRAIIVLMNGYEKALRAIEQSETP